MHQLFIEACPVHWLLKLRYVSRQSLREWMGEITWVWGGLEWQILLKVSFPVGDINLVCETGPRESPIAGEILHKSKGPADQLVLTWIRWESHKAPSNTRSKVRAKEEEEETWETSQKRKVQRAWKRREHVKYPLFCSLWWAFVRHAMNNSNAINLICSTEVMKILIHANKKKIRIKTPTFVIKANKKRSEATTCPPWLWYDCIQSLFALVKKTTQNRQWPPSGRVVKAHKYGW